MNGSVFVKSEPEVKHFNVSHSLWLVKVKLYIHIKTSVMGVKRSVACIQTRSLEFPIKVDAVFCCVFYSFTYDSFATRLMKTMLDILKIPEA
jgi:type III secretory pathway component EscS